MTKKQRLSNLPLQPLLVGEINASLHRGRQPSDDDSQSTRTPSPILAQLEDAPDHHLSDDDQSHSSEGDYENADGVAWPRPAWGFVLLALAAACWVVSPRGFLAGWFLSDVFFWAATACSMLGLIILLGRWLVPDEVDDSHGA